MSAHRWAIESYRRDRDQTVRLHRQSNGQLAVHCAHSGALLGTVDPKDDWASQTETAVVRTPMALLVVLWLAAIGVVTAICCAVVMAVRAIG